MTNQPNPIFVSIAAPLATPAKTLAVTLISLLTAVTASLTVASRSLAAASASGRPGSTIDRSIVDSSVDPCDDFYQYACGTWIKNTPLPADQPVWARSFSVIDLENRKVLRTILEDYAKKDVSLANPYAEKLGDFYAGCMDESQQNALPKRFIELKEKLENVSTPAELARFMGAMHLKWGWPGLFFFYVDQDPGDATRNIAQIWEAGFSLFDRDYYLSSDSDKVDIRKQFETHVGNIFKLLGKSPTEAEKAAAVVLALETRFARNSHSNEEMQDPKKIYNLIDVGRLKTLAPSFDWNGYFAALGLPAFDQINVSNVDFLKGFSDILVETPLEDLKTFILWHMTTASSEILTKEIKDEGFDFFSRKLSGQQVPEDRWRSCVNRGGAPIEQALSTSFIQLKFSADAKSMASSMIDGIRTAFGDNLPLLNWLDDPTRDAARDKLKKVTPKIGYPDKAQDLSSLQIDRGDYFGSMLNVSEFKIRDSLSRLGQPVDRTLWIMPAQMVNAYYNPSLNEIVFPAGILQNPFFDATAPIWENLGAVGVVMGHELTHGFDHAGSQYDGDGNLRNWWTSGTSKEFDARTQCLVDQYSSYEVAPGVKVNGALTVNENIADQGGLKLALKALERQQPSGLSSVEIQRQSRDFFLAFAQSWCSVESPEYVKLAVNTDTHSPSKFRVNGSVSNRPEFAQAYACKAGSKMAPVNRCEIW